MEKMEKECTDLVDGISMEFLEISTRCGLCMLLCFDMPSAWAINFEEMGWFDNGEEWGS